LLLPKKYVKKLKGIIIIIISIVRHVSSCVHGVAPGGTAAADHVYAW
uniref:Secreted protein n=1 Tax=Gongylonema pulchrum TaxID=637853 RepID=A0A183EM98_9BILA